VVSGTKHPKHIFIGLVIPCTDHQVDISVLSEDTFDDLALVDRHWPDLQVLFAHEDFHREFRDNGVFKMVLTLLGLEFTNVCGIYKEEVNAHDPFDD
jgi:hypothetical protein